MADATVETGNAPIETVTNEVLRALTVCEAP